MIELKGYREEVVNEALENLINKGEIENLNKKQKEDLGMNNELVIKYIDKIFIIESNNDCTIINELYNFNEYKLKELLEKTIKNKYNLRTLT